MLFNLIYGLSVKSISLLPRLLKTTTKSETKELNHILQPGRLACYRYTNFAYKITDENTHVNEPAFETL